MFKKRVKRSGKPALKLVKPQYTLCYGMRIDPGTAPEQVHPHVPVILPDGSVSEMALHVINGSVDEIEARLRHSIEAFFEIYKNK